MGILDKIYGYALELKPFYDEPRWFPSREAALHAGKAALADSGAVDGTIYTFRLHRQPPSASAHVMLARVRDRLVSLFPQIQERLRDWPHATEDEWSALEESFDSIVRGWLRRTGNAIELSTITDIEEHTIR